MNSPYFLPSVQGFLTEKNFQVELSSEDLALQVLSQAVLSWSLCPFDPAIHYEQDKHQSFLETCAFLDLVFGVSVASVQALDSLTDALVDVKIVLNNDKGVPTIRHSFSCRHDADLLPPISGSVSSTKYVTRTLKLRVHALNLWELL